MTADSRATEAPPQLDEMAEAAHEAWHRAREAEVASATGNLSLTLTRWFPAGTPEDAARAAVEAELAERREDAERHGRPADSVVVTALERKNIDTGEPERGLRVWDAHSPAIEAFEGIDAFPYDPEWVIEAEFVPAGAGRTLAFEHIRDAGATRELVAPGDIVFERDGRRFELSAYDSSGRLLLVFGDLTNGDGEEGSYAPGRFLAVDRDPALFGEGGPVTLDFNRAFVPPCGFSAQYNCPMPPPQNRLPWAVRAGERQPRFRDGFDLYAL
ncbi:DUF1684 domain-containing protein [Leucobacter sp. CSA1]|uniref:DUF1684 domain-containing protein n=1 Tax=Leucobacter chromiisoli TaxID=2796471 RepID=A0A934UVD4_9MICO|nr:DUF1684 domain-containing protein [Leucobacter chromiisoli]MBK0419795.1 DUF1684 domain-containing protein [Leucobacter chromiisoli]